MGHSPFKDKTTKNTIVNIKLHELKFDKEISEDCKDLINKLLEVNKEKRLNIKDILTHNFVKKNENLINSFSSNKLFNNSSALYLDNENDYTNSNININNNTNSNINMTDIIISKSISPFKTDYSRSITSSKCDTSNNNNNSNYFTPKKMNSNNYINEKKNSPYSNSKIIYLKNNPKFAKIRDTIVEKSRKQMGSLNLKKSKRYSFEEIKEHNKKIQESKKLNNNNIHKINRELVRFNSLKNPLIDEKNKVIPPFDENIFINELINICKKHSKDKIIK
jgi:serine/threonine protein kinase